MAETERFDWLRISAMLENIAPAVLRTFPHYLTRDIEDIVQDTLLKLHRLHRKGYANEPSRNLLAVMIKHQAIDRMRARGRLSSLHDIEIVDVSGERSARQQDRAELWRKLSAGMQQLSDEDRLLLMKYYRGKMKIQELADEAGVGYSAMAVRLFRIKEKLRQVLHSPTD